MKHVEFHRDDCHQPKRIVKGFSCKPKPLKLNPQEATVIHPPTLIYFDHGAEVNTSH